MLSPATSIASVRRRLKDSSVNHPTLEDDDLDIAIQGAVVADYSRHRPRRLTIDLDGSGSSYYLLNGTGEDDPDTGWVSGFSVLDRVEYPAILDPATSTDMPRTLEGWEWELYDGPLGTYLSFQTGAPQEGETIRLTITLPHIHLAGDDPDLDVSTIPDVDLSAVLDLAAGIACLAAVSRTAPSHDGVMKTGLSRQQDQGRWESAAAKWTTRYRNHIGISTRYGAEEKAAGTIHTLTSYPTYGDQMWLTHQRRRLPVGR